jgi:hypothetical protein
LLLPPATVLTAGGESRYYAPSGTCGLPNSAPGPTVVDYQVFEPPYLHCGFTRPVIAGWEAAGSARVWTYGTQPVVTHNPLPFGVTVGKVVLLRAGAVTHHADTNQRCVELPFTVLANTDPPTQVRVAVPTKASYLLPRGYYLVFLLSNQGAVSEGKWVKIQ